MKKMIGYVVVFVLAVALIAMLLNGNIMGIASCVLCVLCMIKFIKKSQS